MQRQRVPQDIVAGASADFARFDAIEQNQARRRRQSGAARSAVQNRSASILSGDWAIHAKGTPAGPMLFWLNALSWFEVGSKYTPSEYSGTFSISTGDTPY